MFPPSHDSANLDLGASGYELRTEQVSSYPSSTSSNMVVG
jgi:hypothetical protein